MFPLKKILPPLFLLFASASFAQVNFIDNDWDMAKAKAKQENKLIFMDCYTTWCGWCKVMDKETFTNSAVIEMLSNNFISLKMDMEKSTGMKLAMKYGVSGFPTLMIFNSSAQLVYRSAGFLKAEPFIATLKSAMEKREPVKGYSDELDLNYPKFLIDVSDGDPGTKYPREEVVVAYLDHQTDLYSELNWAIIKRFHPGGKYKLLFLDNMDKYKSLYGEAEVSDHLDEVFYAELNRAIKDKSEAEYKDVLVLIEKYKSEEAQDYKMEYDITYYRGTENWPAFAAAVQHMIDKKSDVDAAMINDYSWDVCEKCDDPHLIKMAVNWMSKAVEKEPEYNYLDTYAALLYKANDYATAKKYADEALAKGKEQGENTQETEELLAKINAALKK
ncbi:MAG: DUF255 domain-containing protein [Bacteroidia bacterium]